MVVITRLIIAGFWHVSFGQLNHVKQTDAHITEALLRPPVTGAGNLKCIGSQGALKFVRKLAQLVSSGCIAMLLD